MMKLFSGRPCGATKNAKRGESIVEAVVTIFIIMVISVAALTSIRYAEEVIQRTRYYSEARNYCSNAMECFIYAESADEFAEAFRPYSKEAQISVYANSALVSVSNNYYVLSVSVSYYGNSRPRFSANAVRKSGYTFLSLNYLRGLEE